MTQAFAPSYETLPQGIQIFRDNDLTIAVSVVDVDGAPFNISAFIGWFMIKERDTHNELSALVLKQTNDILQGKINNDNVSMEFYLTRSDTSGLKSGVYIYDCGIYNSTAKYTVCKGQVELVQPVHHGDFVGPAAPVLSTAVPGTLKATLTWVAPAGSPAADHYRVYYGTTSSCLLVGPLIAAPLLTCEVTGLLANTTYYFKVYGVTVFVKGAASNILSCTTPV